MSEDAPETNGRVWFSMELKEYKRMECFETCNIPTHRLALHSTWRDNCACRTVRIQTPDLFSRVLFVEEPLVGGCHRAWDVDTSLRRTNSGETNEACMGTW